MNNLPSGAMIELVCVIVNNGLASKILKYAKNHGITGGTVMLGHGTIKNRLLNFVGLADVRKEVIFMVAAEDRAEKLLDEMSEHFEFHKPNHGIAFSYPVCGLYGTKSIPNSCGLQHEQGAENTMYHSITTIVDKGKAEEVISAATKAGSKGGTIINARGSGIHETSRVFAMEIEPEKEIVIILAETESTDAIVNAIREKLKIEEPGHGIIYVQDIKRVYGIYK
ncbi:MAG: P-II family nitrogen regulator [Christensenellales bacterium]|jgi:nitrogen regulatory protein PII